MSDNFIQALADATLPAIEKFYQDPKNREGFEKWLAEKKLKEVETNAAT